MYAWGHLRMKKNKDRPLIKTQLAKIVVIQVAILLAFLVLFTVKETDQTLLIWRSANADLSVFIK